MWALTPESLFDLVRKDPECIYRLGGFTGAIRVILPPRSADLIVVNGVPTEAREPAGDATLTLSIPAEVMAISQQQKPPPGYQALSMAQARGGGAVAQSDALIMLAAYMGALSRIFDLLRRVEQKVVDAPLPNGRDPFRDTDTAIGRYVWVNVDGIDYRLFYEEAGTGETALLLQHTAGADGRQWRHQLADPEFQKRFRVIAYDLPFHGRSLPPTTETWWSHPYKPNKVWMMKVVVALADALGLDQPLFMGCSVGGQLALDLAAHYGSRFGGFVSLNGTLDNPMPSVSRLAEWNELCRDNRYSSELYSVGCFNVTLPGAPEAFRRELYWLYRSNAPGVYAGDNDYFATGHDLKIDGHLIDPERVPIYLLAGEYDPVATNIEHGGPAVVERIPGIVYKEMKGLSHFAPTDDPLAFRSAILPILDEILEKSEVPNAIAARA
jgi:pimeloyl-ACP methyl ester carboxylesterase